MSMRRFFLAGAAALLVFASAIAAQAPSANPPTAKLAQVMRGILFPSSNVIFAAQHDEFVTVKPDANPWLSTDASSKASFPVLGSLFFVRVLVRFRVRGRDSGSGSACYDWQFVPPRRCSSVGRAADS
jgi:hypothetical protein